MPYVYDICLGPLSVSRCVSAVSALCQCCVNPPPVSSEPPELTITNALAVGKSRIYLSWAVSDGNSAITGYRLQYMQVGSDQWLYWSEPVPVNASSARLTGLEPSRGYRLRLTAVNRVGRSAPVEVGQNGELITQESGEAG